MRAQSDTETGNTYCEDKDIKPFCKKKEEKEKNAAVKKKFLWAPIPKYLMSRSGKTVPR